MNWDRRTTLVSLVGIAGASLSYRFSSDRRSIDENNNTGGRPASARPAQQYTGPPGIKSVSVLQLPLGGGGFVTGIDVSKDGRRFACRTDVANAYVRDAAEAAWRPLFSPRTMQPSDYDPLPELGKADGQGVAGIRIAPSNPDVIYASYYGYIWTSLDGGNSVRRTRLPQKAMPSNGGFQRLFNRTIDVHPTDARNVFVGTHGEGAWYSLDGGDSWGRAVLPDSKNSLDGKPGLYLIQYDPVRSDRVYVFVTGQGLYSSDAGPGGEFRQIAGGPTHCSNLVAAADGTIYLCEHTNANNGRLWKYAPPRGWTSTKPEHEALVIASDPKQPRRIIAANANGFMMSSSDAAESFQSIGGAAWSQQAGEVAWMSGLTTMFPSEIRFDPVRSGQIWIAQGVGVAKSGLGTKIVLTDWSAGIEELCAVAAVAVPGGNTFFTAWDKPIWRLDSRTAYANNFRYPVAKGMSPDASLVSFCSYIDYAGNDPRYLVAVVAPSDKTAPGYSADGGDSWSQFEGTPATGWGYGGCIAASTKENIVLLPSNNGVGVFTRNGGKDWAPIRLDGRTPTGGFANAYYVSRKNIAADKSRPGTFALIYTVIKDSKFEEPLGGVWLTKDGGVTWRQTLRGVVSDGDHSPAAVGLKGQDNRQFWQCQLEYVPGRPGELVYTPHADYTDDRFYWSQDDGENWKELHPSVRNVTSFGFGKAASQASPPVVFFWGDVDRIKGLFVSLDWFKTKPLLATRFPSAMLAKISFVAGDPNQYGRAYVGTSCAGWIQVDIA